MGEEEKKICGFNMAGEGEEKYLCREPVHKTTDRCIFHADTHAKESEEDKEKFQERLKKRIEDGTDIIDCRRFIFPEEAWRFSGENVNKTIDFSGAQFPGGANFYDTVFREDVSFRGAKFGKRLDFRVVKFGGEVSFVAAVFDKEVTFNAVIFAGPAHFGFATFGGLAYFHQVKFWGNVNFRRVTFEGYTTFDLIENRFTADFSETNFKNEALYERIYRRIDAPDNWNFIHPGTLDVKPIDENAVIHFTDVRFLEKGRITFPNTNVSKYSFRGTSGLKDERTVSFINVDWDRPGDSKRKMIGDEDLVSELIEKKKALRKYAKAAGGGVKKLNRYFKTLNEGNRRWLFEVSADCRCKYFPSPIKEDIKKIKSYDKNILNKELSKACENSAEAYRRLRLNYEVRLAYEEASDFHIGQMEMLLKNPNTHWLKRRVLWLYRAVSNFGESVGWPLVWFIVLWATFFAIWLVLPARREFAGIINTFQGNFDWPWEWLSKTRYPDITEFGWYIWRKFWFAASNFITFPESEGTYFERFLGGFQRFLGVTLATFFILALRRAFRR